MHDSLLTQCELADASGARPAQIEFWCKRGILVPAKESLGHGFPRGFDHQNILEATQYAELTRAGLNSRQLLRIAAVQRERLASLAPEARVVACYRIYITTITTLATIFGRGPGYDAWLKTQTQMLRQMEKSGEPAADGTLDDRLLAMVIARTQTQRTAAPALAG
jgi:hypothetical protein